MKFLIAITSLLLAVNAVAKSSVTTKEFLKFVCNEGDDARQEIYTLLQTIGKESDGSILFIQRTVDVQDCSTLPQSNPNYCEKMAGVSYLTWNSDQYVDGFASVYTLAGTSFYDFIATDPDTELFTQRIVTISDPEEEAKFYDLSQRFDPTKEQINMYTSFVKNCRVISYNY